MSTDISKLFIMTRKYPKGPPTTTESKRLCGWKVIAEQYGIKNTAR